MTNLMEMTNTDVAAHMEAMKIAAHNDLAREALVDDDTLLFNAGVGLRSKVLLTSGISANTPEFRAAAIKAVGEFDSFDADNDPNGTHEFGSIIIDGETVFWKIDLYDEHYEFGAENPTDFKMTRRVLTIMLASEY